MFSIRLFSLYIYIESLCPASTITHPLQISLFPMHLSSTQLPNPLHLLLQFISSLHHTQKGGNKMVKFSKELEAQLIPEWKEAFVNYWDLKKQIKRIKLSKVPKQAHQAAGGDFGFSIFDSLGFFLKKFACSEDNITNIIKVNILRH